MAGQAHPTEDAQLDSLLDEALEGFDAAGVAPSAATPAAGSGDRTQPEPAPSGSSRGPAPPPAGLGLGLGFDPLKARAGGKRSDSSAKSNMAAAEAAGAMQADKMARQMANLMKDLADSTTGEVQTDAGGEEKILDLAATLSSLADKTRATAGPEVVPDNVNDELFGQLTQQIDDMQETPEVQSLIDGLMRQLLSKEVLHQPMADIAAKYPGWLEAQRAAGALSAAELAKYEEQHACIRQVCALYEAEPIDFDAVVEAMQKVQAHGQPPAEIVSELAPGLQFDGDGLPSFPAIPGMGGGGQEQCCIQ
mmetsp:Transcript_9944/g.25613  ORF Transcript_9944/g.25613 Transcript_9944/m.25613 type:complete len:307 (-) Transcript_9944:38-958(-)